MDHILHAREHLPVYDVAGPRDAFPIVLLHVAVWTRKMWLPQLNAGFFWKAMPQTYRELAAHDFHALLRMFPGHVLIVNGANETLTQPCCSKK